MANPIKLRLADLLDHDLFTPRELSWLSFNARVLQEAADKSGPLIARLRYLGIFSNNLDEFFRVRVAEVRRLISMSSGGDRQQSKDLLAAIQQHVVELQKEFDRIYKELLHELQERRIFLVNETQLDPGQAAFVQEYFTSTVLPELEPILLSESQPIPALNDESLYLAVDIRSGEDYNYAVVEVPTDRLERFIENVLHAGRIEHGEHVAAFGDVDVRRLVDDGIERIRARYHDRVVHTDVTDERDDAVPVHGDGDILTLIVSNLLDNAVKYSEGEPRIDVVLRREGGRTVVTVRDHGQGIEPRDLRRVFHRFYRAEAAVKRMVRGTGIGLYVAAELARQLGATLTAHSDGPGTGARFDLSLPERPA